MIDKRFETLCNNIIHGLCEMDPVNATYLGIHNYDGVYPRIDAEARAAHRDQLDHFLSLLDEFTERQDELQEGNRIDLELIRSQIKTVAFNDFQLDSWRRNPARTTEAFLFGLYLLNIREYLSPDLRLNSILNRLRDSSRFFNEAIENLAEPENIPRVMADIAFSQLQAGEGYLAELDSLLRSSFAARISEISEAMQIAGRTLKKMAEYLSGIAESCTGEFAIGEESFAFLLREHHMLTDSPADLEHYGRQMIEETRAAMKSTVEEIDAGKSVGDVLAELKRDHPDHNTIVAFYQEEMERAREFVAGHDLASIPDNQELVVDKTPLFQRSMIPFAAYVPPPPFAGSNRGLFWVTPPDLSAKPEDLKKQLSEHSRWGVPITALHEGFPGHHLQLVRAKNDPSPVRRSFMTSVFVEGWALYCEEMMQQEGFLSDPRYRLMQLNDQLWRSCRVVIDVGLHCNGMTMEEAERMLVDVAGLAPNSAAVEVRRYTTSPTQPLSYLTGKREMLRLRRDWQKANPDRTLKEFHDAVLDAGSIPFRMMRRLLKLQAG